MRSQIATASHALNASMQRKCWDGVQPAAVMPKTEKQWYEEHGCAHAHCPDDCEHPQPFMDGDDLICGRCAAKYGERTVMVPCIPPLCDV